jgi:hypothetical protein
MNVEDLKKQKNHELSLLANDGSYDACMILAHRYEADAPNKNLKLACKFSAMGHQIERNTGVKLELGFASFLCACCFQKLNDISSACEWYLISGREGHLSGFYRAAMLQENVFGLEARKILKEGMEKGSLPCELKYLGMASVEASYVKKIYFKIRSVISILKFVTLKYQDEYSFRVRV